MSKFTNFLLVDAVALVAAQRGEEGGAFNNASICALLAYIPNSVDAQLEEFLGCNNNNNNNNNPCEPRNNNNQWQIVDIVNWRFPPNFVRNRVNCVRCIKSEVARGSTNTNYRFGQNDITRDAANACGANWRNNPYRNATERGPRNDGPPFVPVLDQDACRGVNNNRWPEEQNCTNNNPQARCFRCQICINGTALRERPMRKTMAMTLWEDVGRKVKLVRTVQNVLCVAREKPAFKQSIAAIRILKTGPLTMACHVHHKVKKAVILVSHRTGVSSVQSRKYVVQFYSIALVQKNVSLLKLTKRHVTNIISLWQATWTRNGSISTSQCRLRQ